MTASLAQDRAGFSLLEMAIVLAILGSVTAAIFQLTQAQGRRAQDRIVAEQFTRVLDAAEQHLQLAVSTYVQTGKLRQPGETLRLTVDDLKRAGTYGPGFSNENILGSTYTVAIRRLYPAQPMSFELLVLTEGEPLDDLRLGSIAGIVGARGGLVSAEFGDNAGDTANGTAGSWQARLRDFGLQGARNGQIAGLSFLGFGNGPM